MDRHDWLRVVGDESAALLAAAESAGPAVPVPGCPDWTVDDLVWHVGRVHDFWAYVVDESAASPDGYRRPARPGPTTPDDGFGRLLAFAADRAAALTRTLGDADLSTPVWTWTGPQPAAWVVRRMAHETAVHRLDAEASAGRDHRLDPVLAADGIDEFLTFFTGPPPAGAPLTGTVHLHCVDTMGEWTAAFDADGGYTVRREHAKGDVALRGAAHDLLMVLWRRSDRDRVETFGDPVLAEAFLAATRRA